MYNFKTLANIFTHNTIQSYQYASISLVGTNHLTNYQKLQNAPMHFTV